MVKSKQYRTWRCLQLLLLGSRRRPRLCPLRCLAMVFAQGGLGCSSRHLGRTPGETWTAFQILFSTSLARDSLVAARLSASTIRTSYGCSPRDSQGSRSR